MEKRLLFFREKAKSFSTALFTDIINDFYNIAATVCSASVVQGPPTHDGFFEFDILGTLEVVTSHFDSPNFSKHAGIW